MPDAVDLIRASIDKELAEIGATQEDLVRRCPVSGCDNVVTCKDNRCAKHTRLKLGGKEAARIANEIIQDHAAELAEHVIQASRIAAADGDHKPAAWALIHGRAVAPVVNEAPAQQIQVIVGVRLPGLPQE